MEVLDKNSFQIFGSVDCNEKGVVQSTYPSWYHDHLRDELQNEVDRLENDIKFDRIPKSELQLHKERLKQKQEKLLNLDQNAVTLRGKQKDQAKKIYDDLGTEIKNSLFSRSDMQNGTADAREEMLRMTEPCIEVKGDVARAALACNVKVVKGKVTRDGAAKVWKIFGKALGERTNIECLRRD